MAKIVAPVKSSAPAPAAAPVAGGVKAPTPETTTATTEKAAVAGETGPVNETSRIPYPGLKDAEDKPVKLELTRNADGKLVLPTDYDAKLHSPLKRGDFNDAGAFYELRAQDFEARAKGYREEAEEARTVGTNSDRAKLKKMKKMQEQFEKLKAELAGQGINVDQFLGTN